MQLLQVLSSTSSNLASMNPMLPSVAAAAALQYMSSQPAPIEPWFSPLASVIQPAQLNPLATVDNVGPLFGSLSPMSQTLVNLSSLHYNSILASAGALMSTSSSSSSNIQQQDTAAAAMTYIPLSAVEASQLVGHMPHIAAVSGADVGMETIPPHGVCLRLHGSRTAIATASSLVQLLISS
jgi:hypothetical protein